MTYPAPKVEIGFDLVGTNAPFFTLNSPTKGVLDNTEYPLSGTAFYDVTDKVKSISVKRGKNRQLDQYDAGLANIVFNNNDRTFDPEYALSPFYGQIIPKRAIKISSGNREVFTGIVDDWNLNYDPSGLSEASASCSDAFSTFRSQTLTGGTAITETTGERINTILSSSDLNWPDDARTIETGRTQLDGDVIPPDTNALEYMRLVTQSEPGELFIGKNGHVVFRDRNAEASNDYLTFSDDGLGVGYQDMQVVYGSELLFNEIVLNNYLDTTVTASDAASIAQYGILNLTQSNLLIPSSTDLVNIAVLLASQYSQPEYRFESISVILDKYEFTTQARILDLEIGDVVAIKFTPNNVPPSIDKFASIIRIDHSITPEGHLVSFGFSTIDKSAWTLSDQVFGRLSANNILTF